MTEHIHYMRLESPNGTPTVRGKCRLCSYVREYKSAGETYIAPADKGGEYRRPFPRIPKDVLADEQ